MSIDITKLKHPERHFFRYPENAQSKVSFTHGYGIAKFADGWRVSTSKQGWDNPLAVRETRAEAIQWAHDNTRTYTMEQAKQARLEKMAEELRANGYIVSKR